MIMAVGVHEVTLSRLEIIPTYAEHVLGTLPSLQGHAHPKLSEAICSNAVLNLSLNLIKVHVTMPRLN